MTAHSVSISGEVLREVVENLNAVKGKSLLALAGIVIGTAAVIAMLHVGHNARREALMQFETLGTDLVMMQPQPGTSGTMPQLAIRDVLDVPQRNIGLSSVAAIIQAEADFQNRHAKDAYTIPV